MDETPTPTSEHPKLTDPPSGALRGTQFRLLRQLKDLRQFQAAIIELARSIESEAATHGVLVLEAPSVSAGRLFREWPSIVRLLQPGIAGRMAMAIQDPDQRVPIKVAGFGPPDLECAVCDFIRASDGKPRSAVRRPREAFFEILRLLLIHWFRRSGPLTTKAVCEESGFSYPTVAAALERLGPDLLRHSSRQVELRSFPKAPWFKLVASAENVRSQRSFVDRSGRPRSVESLIGRLKELARSDVAVGGVPAVRHHFPGLDLVGTPRLDLVVHSGNLEPNTEFIRQLDPALAPASIGEPPRVVLNVLRRPVSFFETGPDGSVWADQVECLLDLHDARLEYQVGEFIEHLTRGLHT